MHYFLGVVSTVQQLEVIFLAIFIWLDQKKTNPFHARNGFEMHTSCLCAWCFDLRTCMLKSFAYRALGSFVFTFQSLPC